MIKTERLLKEPAEANLKKILEAAREKLYVKCKTNLATLLHFATISNNSNSSAFSTTESQALSWDDIGQRIYVEPEAQRMGDQVRISLQARLSHFLQIPTTRVAVVVGDPGAGKSTFAKHWLKTRLAAYKENPSQPLPIFIILNNLFQDPNVDPQSLLEGYLQTKVGLSPIELDVVKAYQPLLVFCDGYDEVAYEGNLYQDNQWYAWPHAKFILTTRPEKFGTALASTDLRQALIGAFSPIPLETLHEAPQGLEIYQLCTFNEANIKAFVKQWQVLMPTNWNINDYLTNLKAIPGLAELTTNPIILSLVLYVLPDIVKDQASRSSTEQQQVQRTTIYDYFVGKWFTTQTPRIWQKLKELNPALKEHLRKQKLNLVQALREYSIALGRWCLYSSIYGKLTIEIPSSETLKEYLLPEFCKVALADYNTKDNIHNLLIALRSGCLLRCDSHYFRFFHKSLVEYFAQEHIFKGIVGRLSFEEQCEELKFEMAEVNLLRMLAERTKTKPVFREFLYKVVEASKENTDITTAAANSITILNYAKQPLNLKSLRGIRVSGADLSEANLHGVDLRQAELSRVNFTHTYLESANLTGSNVENCQWGTPSSINFTSKIKVVLYTWGEEWLIAGDKAGEIHFVHPMSWMIEKTLKHYTLFSSESDEVMALVVDGNQHRSSQLLISGSKGGSIYFWSMPSGTYQKQLTHADLQCLAITAQGDCLASGGGDSSIRLWNTVSGKVLYIYHGHKGTVFCVTFSSDGKRLASGGRDTTVHLWDRTSGDTLSVFNGHTDMVWSVKFSPNEQYLASGGDITVRTWDIASGKGAAILKGHTGTVWSITFSSDGLYLASSSRDNTVRLWNMTSGKMLTIFDEHKDIVRSVMFSLNSQYLASGSEDKSVRLWNITTAHQMRAVSEKHTNTVCNVIFSPDGQYLLSYDKNKAVYYWDINSGQASALNWEINSKVLVFSPDAQHLGLDASSQVLLLKNIFLDKQNSNTLIGHTSDVTSIAFSHDGKYLASGSRDQTVRVWNVASGETFRVFSKKPSFALSEFSREEFWLLKTLADKYDAKIKQLDARLADYKRISFEASEIALIKNKLDQLGTKEATLLSAKLVEDKIGHKSAITCIAFSYRQQRLVSGSNDIVILWDMISGQALTEFTNHKNSVVNLVLSPDDQYLATGEANKVCVWNIPSNKLLISKELNEYISRLAMIFSPNGHLVSGTQWGTVCFWEVPTGRCLQIIHCSISITHMQFCRDQLYVTGYDNKKIQGIIFTRNSQDQYVSIRYLAESGPVADENNFWQQLKLDKTHGLTPHQYKRLLNHGAIGQPMSLAYAALSNEEQAEEASSLKALRTLKESLKHSSHCALQVASVFDSTVTVSFRVWAVYLYRITKPTASGFSSGNASTGNRHVYGLAEGLNQLGQRVFIRFDLVEERGQKQVARVQIKTHIVDSKETLAGQQGFIQLCQSKQRLDPQAIIVLRAGVLHSDENELDQLLSKILLDAQRQLDPKAERISYRFLGGREQQNESHNCLSWLRYLLKDFKNIKLPRGMFDALGVDPQAILPTKSYFFALPPEVLSLDVRGWKQSYPRITPNYNHGQV